MVPLEEILLLLPVTVEFVVFIEPTDVVLKLLTLWLAIFEVLVLVEYWVEETLAGPKLL